MAPPYLPLDVLLMIAYEMTNDDGARRFDDLNAFLQVNRTLHHHLNPLLWREAASSSKTTEFVLTHLLNTRNLGRLKYFLELGCNLETILLDLDTDERHQNFHSSTTRRWQATEILKRGCWA
jgi:hypothetical protein